MAAWYNSVAGGTLYHGHGAIREEGLFGQGAQEQGCHHFHHRLHKAS